MEIAQEAVKAANQMIDRTSGKVQLRSSTSCPKQGQTITRTCFTCQINAAKSYKRDFEFALEAEHNLIHDAQKERLKKLIKDLDIAINTNNKSALDKLLEDASNEEIRKAQEPTKAEEVQIKPIICDTRTCCKIYDSYLFNFDYHKDSISLHLERQASSYFGTWICNISFDNENFSKEIRIVNWTNYLSNYIDSSLESEDFYAKYKSVINKISYNMKIIMDVKSSLVLMSKTSTPKNYFLRKKYVKQICDVIFNDNSSSLKLFDPLVDDIVSSMPSSDFNISSSLTVPIFSIEQNTIAEALFEILHASYYNFYEPFTGSHIAKILRSYKK